MDLDELAEAAWRAHHNAAYHWRELPGPIRDTWRAVAQAVLDTMLAQHERAVTVLQ